MVLMGAFSQTASAQDLWEGEHLVATYLPIDGSQEVLLVGTKAGWIRMAPVAAPKLSVTAPDDRLGFRLLEVTGRSHTLAITRNEEITGEQLFLELLNENWLRVVYTNAHGEVTEGALNSVTRMYQPRGGGAQGSSPDPDPALSEATLGAGSQTPSSPLSPTLSIVPGMTDMVFTQPMAAVLSGIALRGVGTKYPKCKGTSTNACSIGVISKSCKKTTCAGPCKPCVEQGIPLPTGCNCD